MGTWLFLIFFFPALLALLALSVFMVRRETKAPLLTSVDIPKDHMSGSSYQPLSKDPVKGTNKTPAEEPIGILHLSDLHGDLFGKDQEHLRRLISHLDVDMIALTGDLVDEKTTRFEPVLEFLDLLPQKPTFFVPGNHDKIAPVSEELFETLSRKNIHILENRQETLTIQGKGEKKVIDIVGIDDPYLGQPNFDLLFRQKEVITPQIAENFNDPSSATISSVDPIRILLSHSPTLGRKASKVYERWIKSNSCKEPSAMEIVAAENNFNDEKSILHLAARNGFRLVLTGHTHGGQVKIPGLGAVFVPGQVFPPKFIEGLYKEKNTSMFITKGLGTSRIPVRFLSRPEVVFIRLFP